MRPVFRWIPERLEKVTTLDALSRPIQKTIGRLVPQGTPLKDLLSGTWLGHPLHPMLTDVVIGAWTSAWFLDLLPTKRTDDASDALVGVGILAALPTAAAGLSDWSELGDGERRVGAFHALGNVTALSLYVLSYVNRRRGNRRSGWILAMLGSGAATFSGLLGGHLSFARGVGVNQTAFDRPPAKWTPVIQESDLRPGRLTGGARIGDARFARASWTRTSTSSARVMAARFVWSMARSCGAPRQPLNPRSRCASRTERWRFVGGTEPAPSTLPEVGSARQVQGLARSRAGASGCRHRIPIR
jgi:uncharacterized membrane protein